MSNPSPRQESFQALGGRARADKLSPEARREIALAAAAARWSKSIPEGAVVYDAVAMGELRIGDLSIACAVLDDGTRVISERGVGRALGRGYGGKDWRTRAADDDAGNLPYFLVSSTLKPFVSGDLALLAHEPILYTGGSKVGGIAHGIKAELIPNICDVWLKARDAGLLNKSQKKIASNADALMRGLAHVGIVALVDEATGYQTVREKGELRKILSAYISEELLPWTQRFPSEFYREMFRLWGWQWPVSGGMQKGPQGPRYAGKLTRRLVYEKLPPGVIDEIERLNPPDEKWQRRDRNHQHLTEEIGQPHLDKQVAVVTALMRISPTKSAFLEIFSRAFPNPSKPDDLFSNEEVNG